MTKEMSLVVEMNGIYTTADGFRTTYTRGGAEGCKTVAYTTLFTLRAVIALSLYYTPKTEALRLGGKICFRIH